MYLLGYDIGSSSIKTALVDAKTKEVVDVVQYPDQEMEMISRQKGWAEQQPELWWRYLCIGTKTILEKNKIDPTNIHSIGISYQMHGLVVVNKEHQVLRPAIIWCDSRAVSIGDRACRLLGSEFCFDNYKNSPGNFTASKLKWIKDNEPDIFEKIHKIMLPGDFIAMKLTGHISTTISGLSEGILWNFKEKKLATRILDYYEIDHSLIPEVLPTFSVSGKLSPEASEQTGLAIDTMVAYRAGDQPNNAMSLNVLRPGEIAATCGTSGVVYGVVDKSATVDTSKINAFAHVNYTKKNPRIGLLLCINGAGIQYSWLRKQIARPDRSYADMERMLESVPVGAEGVLIYPFGNGAERIFSNQNIGSHIRNIEFNRHSRAHIYRAAIEGVAFAFVYGVNLLKESGLEIKKIRVGNDNMFQSEVFAKTISRLLGVDIEVYNTTGAVGAALASGYGSGHYSSINRVMSLIKPVKQYSPVQDASEYFKAYRYWCDNLDELLKDGESDSQTADVKELVEKDKVIAQQNMMLARQRKMLEEVKNQLSSLDGNRHDLSVLNKLLENLGMDDDQTKNTSDHINLLSEPFISYLNSTFPDLSFEELKMCKYLKLKFTTKEIAEKLCLSYRGAETKRYRLRRKMNISNGISIYRFLENIMAEAR
jgi:xylulokinase